VLHVPRVNSVLASDLFSEAAASNAISPPAVTLDELLLMGQHGGKYSIANQITS